MKTLKQIAEENGLSKQAVRKRAQRAGVLDQLQKINGTLYADEAQEQMILAGSTSTETGNREQPTKEPTREAPEPEQAQEAGQLTVFTEHLLQQIQIKDDLIRTLTEQNRKLIESLQFEQAKNKQLTTTAEADQPKEPEPKTEKRSLWQRLFGN